VKCSLFSRFPSSYKWPERLPIL